MNDNGATRLTLKGLDPEAALRAILRVDPRQADDRHTDDVDADSGGDDEHGNHSDDEPHHGI